MTAERLARWLLPLLVVLSIAPLLLVANNSLRSTGTIYQDPLAAFFSTASGSPETGGWAEVTRRNYLGAWREIGPYLLNTLWVCVMSSLLAVLSSLLIAFAFAFGRFPGRRWIEHPYRLALLVPGSLLIIPTYLVVRSLGLLNSYSALIIPYAVGGMVFGVFLLRAAMRSIPRELLEAAQMDGAGPWTCLWQVILPQVRATCSVIALMTFLGSWNNFLWPYLVNSDPSLHVISSGLYFLSDTDAASDLGMLYAAYVLAILPLAVLFLVFTRQFVGGLTAGAVKE